MSIRHLLQDGQSSRNNMRTLMWTIEEKERIEFLRKARRNIVQETSH